VQVHRHVDGWTDGRTVKAIWTRTEPVLKNVFPLLLLCTSVVVLPQFATKNHIVTLSLLPRWDGKENQKEKGKKLVGWDEHSLTEWQREKKITVNSIDEKHIQHAMFSPPDAQLPPE